MKSKNEKIFQDFRRELCITLNFLTEHVQCKKDVKEKILFCLANKYDYTYLQVKHDLETCNFKEIKKSIQSFKMVRELHSEKYYTALELLNELNFSDNGKLKAEIDNYSLQQLSSTYCVVAQNLETKEYARLIFEEQDEEFDAGYLLEFTDKRSEATEITKISESEAAVRFIEKCLLDDFPDIRWKVFQSARMKGRDLTPYPIF